MRLKATDFKVWLWLRQNGQCFLCGEHIDIALPGNTYGSCSVEHLQPKVKGGRNLRNNLAVTHWECNKKRGDNLWLKQVRPPQRIEFRPSDVASAA